MIKKFYVCPETGKPIVEREFIVCPNCGEPIGQKHYLQACTYDRPKYCGHCGREITSTLAEALAEKG
jgi:DNA-directed RNA polymerase subunit RPC12/RpoP